MDLMGGLSNPANRERVARLAACRRRLLAGALAKVAPTPRPPARAGEVAEAVQAVLATHGTMRVGEVFLAVQNHLKREVNRSTSRRVSRKAPLRRLPDSRERATAATGCRNWKGRAKI